MAKKKVAFMIDSEMGWSEKQAREKGYFYVPVIFYWNGKEGLSGIDYTLEYMYENLTKETDFKTSASSIGLFQEEYRRALKEAEHILFVPISKHFSSQINAARMAADDPEFEGKVTIYDSEFIGPWLLVADKRLESMVKHDAPLEKFIETLDRQRGNMRAWLFPKNLERLKASGRLSKTAYMAGTLLKVLPITPIINGMLDPTGVVKTRSPEKAINKIVENCIELYEELKADGNDVEILFTTCGSIETNIYVDMLKKAFAEKGHPDVPATWLPAAVVGHVGLGGIGAGVGFKFKEYEPGEE